MNGIFNKVMKTLKIKDILLPFAAIAVLYLILFTLGITCPIKWLTGISCPGCGMTRAWKAALTLDLQAAFHYHPLWFLLPPFAVLGFLFWAKKKRSAFRGLLSVFVLSLLIAYIFRLASPSDIVVFAPENGAISILIQKISALINKVQ